ncbi:MAG: hypothetical protein M1819_006853 [Sarea resinae]|nr:MAG: hypothetical protein M1819_006853 [Sarea resinae]
MSLLQNEDFVLFHLRSSYLNSIKDGVGERLINLNPSVLNDHRFRAAGWAINASDVKRTYSPPIPTAIASEYFQAPPQSAGLTPAGFGDDEDEGGMVTGGGSTDTVGPGPVVRRKRRKEFLEEEDSSDLSDESDEDADGQRAAQQIRFAKMPVRTRAGSSPIRGSNLKDGPSVLVTSPSRPSGDSRLRRGSLGAVEAVKERARRDTVTSSDLSSENELDPSLFKRKQLTGGKNARTVKASQILAQEIKEEEQPASREDTDGEAGDSGIESAGTSLSSGFAETADSTSLLGDVADPLTSLPLVHIPQGPSQSASPKKSRQAPSELQALPPPRPISTLQPISALGEAIKARKKKPSSPFEAFATFSGKGDPNPLQIKIYVPFSKNPNKPIEMPLRPFAFESDNGDKIPVTVADAIGLSLWRYCEEGIDPPIKGDKMSVNHFNFRMIEDGEVDYDFPALSRNRPIVDFTSNNNRAARARPRDKPYDEFALVEATPDEIRENQRLTPRFTQESSAQDDVLESVLQQPDPTPQIQTISLGPRQNPLMGPRFASTVPRTNAAAPADIPALPTSHAVPRMGASKRLKIHFLTLDAYTQVTTLDVTTDTYLAEVLDTVCKKWNFDKAHHILKVSGTNTVAPPDRTVESLGDRADLDLVRRRFANDGPMSSLAGSPGSSSPNAPLLLTNESTPKKGKKGLLFNPNLAQNQKQDWMGSTTHYRKYNVIRKQPMSFTPSHQRVLAIDGEYMHIMPGDSGRTLFDASGKTTTIHFSSVVGCKVSRRHPKTFRVVIFKERETKRYDFEAHNASEAAEIVHEIKKGVEPFQDNTV